MIRCDFAWGLTSARSRSPTACVAAVSISRSSSGRPVDSAGRRLCLDLFGDLPERDLAQGGQVLDPEEVVERRLDPLARVDLPGEQALDQRLRRDVDQHDLVRDADHGIGDRLAHADAGELADLVVEALEVLDVDGREDIDPGVEHVLNILIALLVLDTRRVGVRELVDQTQLGIAIEDPRQVHLLERRVAIAHTPARDHFEPLGLLERLRAPVRLEVPDHDVPARSRPRPVPRAASDRSCRRRRPSPGRSCSGRGGPAHLELARRSRTANSRFAWRYRHDAAARHCRQSWTSSISETVRSSAVRAPAAERA